MFPLLRQNACVIMLTALSFHLIKTPSRVPQVRLEKITTLPQYHSRETSALRHHSKKQIICRSEGLHYLKIKCDTRINGNSVEQTPARHMKLSNSWCKLAVST